MIIGVPKEVKKDEYRVALLPVGAELLVRDGQTVLIEKGAGSDSGFDDRRYVQAGARIVESVAEIYTRADLIVKVKEPQPAGDRQAPRWPDRLLLLSLRRVAGADGRLSGGGHHGCSLRDPAGRRRAGCPC